MKKKTLIWLGIAVVLLIGSAFLRWGRNGDSSQTWCFQKHCFVLEVAKTSAERAKGLMFRASLDTDKGMVFVFTEATIHPFRMKNTQIPLDMIRLNDVYQIVEIQEAQPCQQDPCTIYTPSQASSYVIELRQGTAKSLVMKPGDVIAPR